MVQEIQKGLGQSWQSYAIGRDNGFDHGESSGILFNAAHWEQIDQGTFWLSEKPDSPGSRSWGAACVRICSWLKLRHRRTGKILCPFNTHLDHISSQARDQGLKLIFKKMATICADGTPYLLTGDFNMLPGEGIMSQITSPKSSLVNIVAPVVWAPLHCQETLSTAVASRHPPTFTGFRNDEAYLIDYILVNATLRVVGYEVLTNRPPNSTVLSDHVPIAAHIAF
jgi:endonuclease/exonuclease/phosphatase family metal-dependent hydrolase